MIVQFPELPPDFITALIRYKFDAKTRGWVRENTDIKLSLQYYNKIVNSRVKDLFMKDQTDARLLFIALLPTAFKLEIPMNVIFDRIYKVAKEIETKWTNGKSPQEQLNHFQLELNSIKDIQDTKLKGPELFTLELKLNSLQLNPESSQLHKQFKSVKETFLNNKKNRKYYFAEHGINMRDTFIYTREYNALTRKTVDEYKEYAQLESQYHA